MFAVTILSLTMVSETNVRRALILSSIDLTDFSEARLARPFFSVLERLEIDFRKHIQYATMVTTTHAESFQDEIRSASLRALIDQL